MSRSGAELIPIALVHQSAMNLPAGKREQVKSRCLWRVKNWEGHPIDPGWDDGRYCVCHQKFRNAQTRQRGEIIVDCVNDGNLRSKGYVVRSYFKIIDIQPCRLGKGRDLIFASYHFCDKKEFRLHRNGLGPLGTRLSLVEWRRLESDPSYNEYRCSPTMHPCSVAKSDWIRMIEEKQKKVNAGSKLSCRVEHQGC